MSASPAVPPLCLADDATFWAWHRWPEFSRWPDSAGTTVIVPLAGCADWGLGHPLDAEEVILMSVLRAAVESFPENRRLLVVPPLRFVLGPAEGCAFAVDPPAAHALVAEVAASIAASGFHRVVFFNSSPWNEELIAAAARDVRIAHRLQLFRISLSGLGLDLHPDRSPDRRKVQTLLTFLLDEEPAEPTPPAPTADGRARIVVAPLTGQALPREVARSAGAVILAAAAQKLAVLLVEIGDRPPLPHDGVIPIARP